MALLAAAAALTMILSAIFLATPGQAATASNGYPYCSSSGSDPDGDGWGWENNASCVVAGSKADPGQSSGGSSSSGYPTCSSSSSDPDGDGWGWENNQSCKVGSSGGSTSGSTSSSYPTCSSSSSDPDGDGWGWENNQSCKVGSSTGGNTGGGNTGGGSSSQGLVGWATQNGGTTGGGSASATTVTSSSALASAVSGDSAKVVKVSGTISCSGMIKVGSNTTVIGSGSNATIKGCGLNIAKVKNVIVRNIFFTSWDDDAVNIETSTNVWIDHNSFTNGYDGAVDTKRAADYVTISWNRVYNHGKSMLLGHSDGNGSQDSGKLRVSYHHNWFDGSNTRHPRVRFGNPVHVFNNYYNGNEYGVASTENGGVLVEGNYFENVDEPTLVGYAGSDPGTLVARNNYATGSGAFETSGSVASIPYSYSLDSASSVKSIVTSGAGAGKL